ncbi:hypothetical protein DB346_16705 [Verrucomicrobia bacterium LW23]|nr:hypothetical protein DB346_16705 [Verrucomicrobia bacterium LW23]
MFLALAALLVTAPFAAYGQDVPGGGGPGLFGEAVDEGLVPATPQTREDSFGFAWDITNAGTVTNSSRECFESAAQLSINGAPFTFHSMLATSDGKEYVVMGNAGNFRIMRRIRLDEDLGLVRYYDVIESKDRNDFKVNVTLQTRFTQRWDKIVTSNGTELTGKTLDRGETGFAVLSRTNRSAALWLISGPRRRSRPEIALTNGNQVEVKFSVPLRAGGRAAILHYVGQRKRLKQEDVKAQFATWQPRGSLPGIDVLAMGLRRVVTNFPPSALGATAMAPVGPLLTRLEALFNENWQLERGPEDTVVLNAETRLTGKLTGTARGELTTNWGKVSFGLDDVAGIVGGGGVGKMQTVFFRDGEVLTGRMTLRDLKLTLAGGGAGTGGATPAAPWTLDVNPDQVLAILCRKDAALEGKPMQGVAAFAELATQDCLGIVDPAAALELNCAWGPLKVQLADIETLGAVREPQFGFRLVLRDKTSLLVFPTSGDVELKTARLGALKIAPQMLLKLSSFQQSAAADPNEGDEGSAEAGQPGAPGGDAPRPTIQLIGENVIVGNLAAENLELGTISGPRVLPTAQIVLMERPGEDSGLAAAGAQVFAVQMKDGSKWTGRLKESVIALRFGSRDAATGQGGSVLSVPVEHFLSFQVPEPPSASGGGDSAEPLPPGVGASLRAPSDIRPGPGRGDHPGMDELPTNPGPSDTGP